MKCQSSIEEGTVVKTTYKPLRIVGVLSAGLPILFLYLEQHICHTIPVFA